MNFDFNVYHASFVIASICAVYRYRMLDNASKIFAIYIWIGSVNEFIATYFAKKYHTNMPVYAIYCLVEFGLISLYFNSSIDAFRKKNIGLYIGGFGIIAGLINIIFVQGVHILTSYFLIFEGIFIIGMGLFSFFQLLLRNDQLLLYKYPHFWFTAILMFFWSITFVAWALFNYFLMKNNNFSYVISSCFPVVGALLYTSISCVFILYPKMQKRV